MTTATATTAVIRSLLVVEDSAVQRGHTARLARGLGVAEIHEACDGTIALALLERLVAAGSRPDVLIIDPEMPVMDGVQLIEQLCARGVDIPFSSVVAYQGMALDALARLRIQGYGLSIASVAEGVETMDDWALLQRLGCKLAQGWLIAKAMPGDEIPGWLRQHAQRLPTLRAPTSQGT